MVYLNIYDIQCHKRESKISLILESIHKPYSITGPDVNCDKPYYSDSELSHQPVT